MDHSIEEVKFIIVHIVLANWMVIGDPREWAASDN